MPGAMIALGIIVLFNSYNNIKTELLPLFMGEETEA